MRRRTVIGSALTFCASYALCVACSAQVVPLNKGHKDQTREGGVGAMPDSGAGGASSDDSGTGPGASGYGPTLTYPDGGPGPLANARSTLQTSHKLDLLLVVDNSISMADKQAVLSRSIPDLVQRITDPSSGITDLHVGVITSSIGGHGSSLCAGNDADPVQQQQNDHGYLLGTRSRFMNPQGGTPANAQGFLEWTAGQSVPGLVTTTVAMIQSAGEHGCGLESQLEAAYRFLIDPIPYQQIAIQKCPGSAEDCATPEGKDTNLLAQRAAFLRPDSAVAVAVLSDENDCSIREGGQYYYAARQDIVLPHGSSVCARNPNDKCCYFCNASPPAGCAADPTCSSQINAKDDPPNLRCFHQKQRFGFDFLYPIQRYVSALSSTYLCTSRADLLPDPAACPDTDGDKRPDIFNNPLFFGENTVRDPSMVYFMSIVGVPYQDIAVAGDPLSYQTPAQLAQSGAWNKILGNSDPANGAPPIPPADSLMVESVDPRTGQDGETPPVALAGPDAAPMANPVNGHEWNNIDRNDLQYSCIFPLPAPRDCAQVVQQTPQPGCDCLSNNDGNHNPLCQASSGSYASVQRYAKAYPGLRELQVSQALGSRGLVASICAANLTDTQQADYGYRPAIDLLLKQIKSSTSSK